MRRKIILLDNKNERQEKIYKVDFSKLDNVENISGDEDCNTLLANFVNNDYDFNDYDFIIIHKNIYYKDIYSEAKRESMFSKLKQDNEGKLIYFTGENNTKLDNNIPTVTSTNMYKNLQIFNDNFTEGKEDILMLQYGQRWEIDILLNVLEQINLFIENGDDYREKVKLSELEKLPLNKIIIDVKDNFNIEKAKNIREIILKNIRERLND